MTIRNATGAMAESRENHLRKRVHTTIMTTYREWEGNDISYGFLITFRTYGTWLHGDARGSVDRDHNVYAAPRIEKNVMRENFHRSLMKREPVRLDREMRMTVEMAIREGCEHKKWDLRVINVRTNHAHAVVSTPDRNHSKVLNAFKAYSTRKMRERGMLELRRVTVVR